MSSGQTVHRVYKMSNTFRNNYVVSPHVFHIKLPVVLSRGQVNKICMDNGRGGAFVRLQDAVPGFKELLAGVMRDVRFRCVPHDYTIDPYFCVDSAHVSNVRAFPAKNDGSLGISMAMPAIDGMTTPVDELSRCRQYVKLKDHDTRSGAILFDGINGTRHQCVVETGDDAEKPVVEPEMDVVPAIAVPVDPNAVDGDSGDLGALEAPALAPPLLHTCIVTNDVFHADERRPKSLTLWVTRGSGLKPTYNMAHPSSSASSCWFQNSDNSSSEVVVGVHEHARAAHDFTRAFRHYRAVDLRDSGLVLGASLASEAGVQFVTHLRVHPIVPRVPNAEAVSYTNLQFHLCKPDPDADGLEQEQGDDASPMQKVARELLGEMNLGDGEEEKQYTTGY